MSHFPLLHLPFVPIGNILEQMSPFQLFNLSYTSKKVAKQIKLGGTKHLKITLKFESKYLEIKSKNDSKSYHISMCYEIDEESDISRCRYIEGHRVEIGNAYDGKYLLTFWDDPAVAVETFGFHLADLFGCPIDTFAPNKIEKDIFLKFIQKISKRQTELSVLTMNNVDLDEKEVEEVLTKLKITGTLMMYLKLSPQFPVALFHNTQTILLKNSSWFTGEMLSQMNCANIQLFDSSLKNQDVDLVLNKWKRGEFSNLQTLHIESSYFDDRTPILGMIPPIMDMNNKEYKQQLRLDICSPFLVCNGVQVSRDNGMAATITFEGAAFNFIV